MRKIFLYLFVTPFLASAADLRMPKFRAVEIDTRIQIGYGVAVADVDGDKKPDIILADKNQIVWYQNPDWKKHVIAENLTKLDHVCIAVTDIDGDGKAEIAAGAGWNPGDTENSGAVFYLQAPADRTKMWKPIELPHEPTVHRMRWVKTEAGKYDLVVVPLHGRGNKNAQGAGAKVLSYQVPTDVTKTWETSVLDAQFHKTHNFEPVGWDKDSEQEILLAGQEGVFLLNEAKEKWSARQLTGNESDGAGEVRLGRLGNNKKFIATVEPMHGTNLVIYTKGEAKLWTRNVLDSSLNDGHALACGDLAGVGSDQIVVGWRAMGKAGAKVGIKLFAAKDAAGQSWEQMLVDDNGMACEDLCLADLNGDGRLDIIAAGRATKNVKVYFNEASK